MSHVAATVAVAWQHHKLVLDYHVTSHKKFCQLEWKTMIELMNTIIVLTVTHNCCGYCIIATMTELVNMIIVITGHWA